MFCPVCKAEYRPGFTRCSECDVALVERLDAAKAAFADPERRQDAALIWSGNDAQMFSALRDALDWAKIFSFAQVGTAGALPSVSFPIYSVLVHRDDRGAAEAVLQTVRPQVNTDESAEEDREGEGSDTLDVEDGQGESAALEESDTDESAPDDIAEDFRADDATAEIWSGDDRGMAETVRMCLRENGIGCAVDQFGGKVAVRVMPQSEARAKEIVREILEGAPPN